MQAESTAVVRTRILIVDDEGIVAMDLRGTLTSMGYIVVGVATSGQKAIQMSAELRPDMVLMDVTLRGDLDGIESAQRIFSAYGIPFVYVTAHSDAATLNRAKVTAPYGYILKPCTAGAMRTTIETALYRFQSEQQLQALQAELARSERLAALGRLVAAIGHEINNPLQSLIGNLYLARNSVNRGVTQQKTTDYLDAVKAEANRIAEIIHRIQDYYQTCADHDSPADICATISEVLTSTAAPLEEHGISVECEHPAALPPVIVPPDQLKQVFRAIILNAPYAMPHGGTLRISVAPLTEDENIIQVSFADTGATLPPEAQKRIFEPFFTPYPETHVYASDLGLPISYQIVQAHGGTMDVRNHEPVGTVFTIHLPVATRKDAGGATAAT